MNSQQAQGLSGRKLCFGMLLLAVLVAAIFMPVQNFSFINLDDNIYVTENSHVNTGLTRENISWAFSEFHGGHWHPLSWISHMADVSLYGLEAGGHHLTNVCFHVFSVVLLFLFLARATGRFATSWFVAALYGSHPLRIESVAWVSERKDVLSVFFALTALNLYLTYARRPSTPRLLACLIVFALSLLSKPTMVTFPVLLLFVDAWPLRRIELNDSWRWTRIRDLIVEKIPFFVVSLGSSFVTIVAQHADGGLKSISDYTISARVANAFASYLIYAGKLFFPTQMAIFYPFEIYPPGVGAGAFLGLCAITFICFSSLRRHPYVAVGWLWFLVSCLPMVGFIQFGGQAFADRWSYVPHIGLLFAVSWWLSDVLVPRLRLWQVRFLYVLIIALSSTWTVLNLPNWKDSESVFRHTLRVAPDNFLAYSNLGVALDRRGKIDDAMVMFQRAIHLRPTYTIALNNLGSIHARKGEYVAAQKLFEQALAIQPDFLGARYHLGLVKAYAGDSFGALTELAKVLILDPKHAAAGNELLSLSERIRLSGCPGSSEKSVKTQLYEIRRLVALLPNVSEVQAIKRSVEELASCFGAL